MAHAEFSLALDTSGDEDEDAAPQEVTFTDSKDAALRRLKLALETTKREKQELKEKRRKRHELFQEQKMEAPLTQFLPVSLQGGYTVKTVGELSLAASQQQAAADFIQDRLYGQESRRTTTKELLSLKSKKGDRKAPSVEFVKKGWAPKHKEKAERLKQRWLHKQQQQASR
ncbi:unnamed protein product [Merluccius merluccius]